MPRATKNTSLIDPVTKHKINLVFPVRVHHADADEPTDDVELVSTTRFIPIDEVSSEMLLAGFLGGSEDGEADDGCTQFGCAADPLDILIAQEEAEAEYALIGGDLRSDDPMEQATPEDDLIHFGQGSRLRAGVGASACIPHTARDAEKREMKKGPRQMVSRRRRSSYMNSESHCPKYGRQDERHQKPRREAKMARREAEAERQYLRWLEQFQDGFIAVCGEELTRTLEEEYSLWSAIEWDRQEFMWAWHNELIEEEERQRQLAYDLEAFDYYDALQNQLDDLDDFLIDLSRPDPDLYYPDWDDFGDYGGYNGCHCRFCEVIHGLDRDSRDIDDADPNSIWFADGDESLYDIFRDDDYGLADDDLDILPVGHSSCLRFTRRYPHSRSAIALPF